MEGQRQVYNNKKGMRALIEGMIFVVAILVLFLVLFNTSLRQTAQKDVNRFLVEIADHTAYIVQTKFDSMYEQMQDVGEIYRLSAEDNKEKVLLEKANELGARWVAVSDKNGDLRLGGETYPMAKEIFMRRALQGQNALSSSIEDPTSGDKALYLAVPFYNENGEKCAIVACYSKQILRNEFNSPSFDGEGYSEIINTDGSFVLAAGRDDTPVEGQNFYHLMSTGVEFDQDYSLEQMTEDISEGKGGITYVTLQDGIRRAITYTPMDIENWYLLTIVQTTVTDKHINSLVNQTMGLNGTVIAVFTIVLIGIWLIYRNNRTQLEELAFVDPVTQADNGVRFALNAAEAISQQKDTAYAIVAFDLENFQLINDSFGTDKGNEVLCHIQETFGSMLVPGEYVARTSGDNFYMLLQADSYAVIQTRMYNAVENLNAFNKTAEHKYFLRVCAGIYYVDKEEELDMIALQDRANTARKMAKRNAMGNNTLLNIRFYDDADRLRLLKEKEIEDRMADALENGEFIIHLQPKINPTTGAVTGAEALVRWEDPEKGLLMPGYFLPVMEANGFIAQVDLHVFTLACKLIRRWIDEGTTPIPISANVSRANLQIPDFLDQYIRVMQKYDVPPHLLQIELTETVVFDDIERLSKIIRQIHEIGMTFAIDDFGSGYSTLSLLSDVNADVLKLDGSFFRNEWAQDDKGRLVVEGMVNMARKLQMYTVAEGVEQVLQLEYLREIGCEQVQGYVFSKPLPVQAFEQLIKEQNQ